MSTRPCESSSREEQFAPVLVLHQRLEGRRDLQPPLFVNACGRVPSKHATLLHFWPQFSTKIVGEGRGCVNAKGNLSTSYAKVSPYYRPLGVRPVQMTLGSSPNCPEAFPGSERGEARQGLRA